MKTKLLEIRDRATFFIALCIDMNPDVDADDFETQRWALRTQGFPCDGRPNIMFTNARGGQKANNDCFYWTDRTYSTAHRYIEEHWNELSDGDVIDVEFILGETTVKKISERFGDLS